MGARAEFVFVREKDDAGMQGDWALVTMRAGSDSAMVLALPDPPSGLEAPRMSGGKLDAGVGGAGFLGIGHLSAAALLCSRGVCVCVGGGAALEWSQMASARRAAGRPVVRGRGPQRLRKVCHALPWCTFLCMDCAGGRSGRG